MCIFYYVTSAENVSIRVKFLAASKKKFDQSANKVIVSPQNDGGVYSGSFNYCDHFLNQSRGSAACEASSVTQ